MALRFSIYWFLILLLSSCLDAPEYPNQPVVEFVSFSKDTVNQAFSDSAEVVTLIISFTDGDGDINTDEINLTLIDGRTNEVFSNFITPDIPEAGAGNGLSGELRIRLNTQFCCIYDNGQAPCQASNPITYDALAFKFLMRDRAGNVSDTLRCPPLYIRCN